MIATNNAAQSHSSPEKAEVQRQGEGSEGFSHRASTVSFDLMLERELRHAPKPTDSDTKRQ